MSARGAKIEVDESERASKDEGVFFGGLRLLLYLDIITLWYLYHHHSYIHTQPVYENLVLIVILVSPLLVLIREIFPLTA